MPVRRLPRGHSNVYAEETEPYPENPAKARVPLVGGGTVFTVKPLPPLALGRDEWEEIGRRMGWLTTAVKKANRGGR